MNSYIEAQCRNMAAIVKTFKTSCEMAAKQDDGTISKQEAKALDKINKAADVFLKELGKI